MVYAGSNSSHSWCHDRFSIKPNIHTSFSQSTGCHSPVVVCFQNKKLLQSMCGVCLGQVACCAQQDADSHRSDNDGSPCLVLCLQLKAVACIPDLQHRAPTVRTAWNEAFTPCISHHWSRLISMSYDFSVLWCLHPMTFMSYDVSLLWCLCPMMSIFYDFSVPWCQCHMVSMSYDVNVPWCQSYGVNVLWCQCPIVSVSYGVHVLWCHCPTAS